MYKKYSSYLAFLIFALTALVFLALPFKAHALTMQNLLYILQMGNLNSFAGNKSNGSYKLSDTGGQLGAGLYTGTNYKVRSGFQYIHSIIRFAFSISGIDIVFGSLDANTPVDRASTLTVTNGSAHGFVVTASENHQLLVPATGSMIPDTACDSGPCTTTSAAPWVVSGGTSTTFGFGYNCTNVSGSTCPADFVDGTYFRPFAASPSAATVMSSTNVGKNLKVQIKYRANVSGTQAQGLYSNVIMYIATPTF